MPFSGATSTRPTTSLALQNHDAIADDDRSRDPLSSIEVPTLVIQRHGGSNASARAR